MSDALLHAMGFTIDFSVCYAAQMQGIDCLTIASEVGDEDPTAFEEQVKPQFASAGTSKAKAADLVGV